MAAVAELFASQVMNKLSSLSVWQQYALVVAWVLPWVAFGTLATDILPETWQFQTWPAAVRGFFIALFCIFVIADVIFSVWFLFLRCPNEPMAESFTKPPQKS